jgi:mono/diheme cytochrome c family protein
MKNTSIFLTLTSLLLAFSMFGCFYDNEEELYPGGCDTTNVTYLKSIAPLFTAHCNSCHYTGNPDGYPVTDNYNDVKKNIVKITNSINYIQNAPKMPKDAPKLSDCELTKIDIWVRNGMPNN